MAMLFSIEEMLDTNIFEAKDHHKLSDSNLKTNSNNDTEVKSENLDPDLTLPRIGKRVPKELESLQQITSKTPTDQLEDEELTESGRLRRRTAPRIFGPEFVNIPARRARTEEELLIRKPRGRNGGRKRKVEIEKGTRGRKKQIREGAVEVVKPIKPPKKRGPQISRAGRPRGPAKKKAERRSIVELLLAGVGSMKKLEKEEFTESGRSKRPGAPTNLNEFATTGDELRMFPKQKPRGAPKLSVGRPRLPKHEKKKDTKKSQKISYMIMEAIEVLNKRGRGASYKIIVKYLVQIYKVDLKRTKHIIRRFLIKAVQANALCKLNGKGLRGSFRPVRAPVYLPSARRVKYKNSCNKKPKEKKKYSKKKISPSVLNTESQAQASTCELEKQVHNNQTESQSQSQSFHFGKTGIYAREEDQDDEEVESLGEGDIDLFDLGDVEISKREVIMEKKGKSVVSKVAISIEKHKDDDEVESSEGEWESEWNNSSESEDVETVESSEEENIEEDVNSDDFEEDEEESRMFEEILKAKKAEKGENNLASLELEEGDSELEEDSESESESESESGEGEDEDED